MRLTPFVLLFSLLMASATLADDVVVTLKPVANMPKVGTCDYGYCANTYCHKTTVSKVCTDDEDGTLYYNDCVNVAEYYRQGTSCCKSTSVCCTYVTASGFRRNYADDIGSIELTCPR